MAKAVAKAEQIGLTLAEEMKDEERDHMQIRLKLAEEGKEEEGDYMEVDATSVKAAGSHHLHKKGKSTFGTPTKGVLPMATKTYLSLQRKGTIVNKRL